MSRAALNVGVLIPCRNEASVIARKLEDLARTEWPSGSRVVVIDDHSSDETVARAEASRPAFELARVELLVSRSTARPGKNGAIEHGLRLLGDSVELVVLTDADVLTSSRAIPELVAAFESNSRLGMACGEQAFVDCLEDPQAARSTAAAWDLLTAWIRKLESRRGVLFSVHGQLLAWRAHLGLGPRAGVAADDVDLMLQVRGSVAPEVRLVEGACFYELKQPRAEGARAQALRRARAWFQVFDGRQRPAGFVGLQRLQWLAYCHLPGLLPGIAALACIISLVLCYISWGASATLAYAVVLGLAGLTPLGREGLATLATIAKARRLERQAAMDESWETERA